MLRMRARLRETFHKIILLYSPVIILPQSYLQLV